jgi:hypothetical protein
MTTLGYKVRRFAAEARKSPALAVGKALDELERAVDRSFDGAFIASTQPVAPYTWQIRKTLLATTQESDSDEVLLGEPVEIVGMEPSILLVGTGPGLVLPPIEAIDVFVQQDRKEVFTATARPPGNQQPQLVNLPFMSTSKRLFALMMDRKKVDPMISMKFRWAVPVATVAAFGWGDTQISVGMFVRTLEECC